MCCSFLLEFIVSSIAFLFLIVLAIDFIPQFNTWQSRIHIGRYTSKEVWRDKLVQKSLQWLHKTPTIKVTDNDRLIILDILKGNYKRNAIQSWQQAALLLGLNDYATQNPNATVSKQINDFVQSKFDANGNWKTNPSEIDDIILAYAILKVDTLDVTKCKPAFDFCYELILKLKGVDGTIAYRKHNPDYRYVDTIGFVSPFLVRYGLLYSINEAVALGINQIEVFNQYGMLHNQFIPCHTYHLKTELPVGLFGWGRGLGWYAIGLIDVWLELTDSNSEKEKLTQYIISFAKIAMQFQNKNGSWNWLVSSPEARADSSTTATLAWFLANASTIESIKKDSINSKNNALNYLMQVTRRNGAIDFSQGDTKAIGVHSQHFDVLPFTQGFTLRTLIV